jgi:uncharacterized protein YjbI with pentapeptide repeats
LDTPDVAAILVGSVAVLLLAIWWLWWRLPKRQVRGLDIQIHDPKARADTEDNLRKTVGQLLGGAAVLIGAGAAYLQSTQQQQAAPDLLISNQVAKNFEQLAGKEMAIRLGGIYGLEGVMNASPDYHQPVLEALCAFVRDGTIGMIVSEAGPATDIQAALTVIGTRGPGKGRVNLTAARVPKADLSDADLSGADMSEANLSMASLSGADLRGASLRGASLRSAYLGGARLRSAGLSDADLSGADLSRADLSGASLRGTSLRGANLSYASLSGASLRGADLSDARLSDADLSGADLSDAKVSQLQLDPACGANAMLPPGLTLNPCLLDLACPAGATLSMPAPPSPCAP